MNTAMEFYFCGLFHSKLKLLCLAYVANGKSIFVFNSYVVFMYQNTIRISKSLFSVSCIVFNEGWLKYVVLNN